MDPHATAGRVVHYYPLAGAFEPMAAHVNKETTKEGLAQLTILEVTGPRVIQRVMYSESPAPGCWSWMEYQRRKAEQEDGNQSESAEPRPVVYVPEDFERLSQHVSEITEVLGNLVERIRVLETLIDNARDTEGDAPPPPLLSQAGQEIKGSEEVPDAAPVDLTTATEEKVE